MQTLRIKISGKVQGVFYRQSTKEKADKLGIKGTVKNCKDETVEIVATGSKEQLDELVKWCQSGPPKAVVSNVNTEELSLQSFNNFSIIRF